MNENQDSDGVDNVMLDSFDLQQALDLLSDNDLLSDEDMAPNSNPEINQGGNIDESRALLESTSFDSSFGSLDGLVNKKESSSHKDSSTLSGSGGMNMEILHWPDKMNTSSSLNVANFPSTDSCHSNVDTNKGKKLKRIFSDVQVLPDDSIKQEDANKEDGHFSHSDNEGEDDDEEEEEEDIETYNKNTSMDIKPKAKETSSRPNVREHSKAQREKRKGNIFGLEQQAQALTDDLNNMNCQFISSLKTCRDRRLQQHRLIVAFLKLWMNDDQHNDNSGIDLSRPPQENIIGFATRQAQWAALFNSNENELQNPTSISPFQQPVTMLLPATYSRFAPPVTSSSYHSSISSPSKQPSFTSMHSSSEMMANMGRSNISFNPQHGGTGTKSRRVLSSLAHIIADSTSLAVMCQNISEFGPVQICHFMLGIDVPIEDFISEDLIAVAPFYLYSKNATMCGGKFEIDLKGYLHCEFTSQGMIKKVELSYDDWHLTEQLLESFGSSIYRPFSDVTFGDEEFHTATRRSLDPQAQGEPSGRDIAMGQILHVGVDSNSRVFPRVNNVHYIPSMADKNSLNDECRVITTLDANVIVEAINQTALDQFGSIAGRSLISADWMGEALAVLSQWAPYVCSLNTVRSSTEDGAPTTETKCLLFSMYDKSVASDGGQSGDATQPAIASVPNKICWIIFNHHGNSHEKQLETIIQQFLRGSVSKFASKLNYIGSSCNFLSFMSLLSQAELILSSDSDDEDEDDDDDNDGRTPSPQRSNLSSGGGREKDLEDFLSMLTDFLKWMTTLESKIWSEDNPLLEIFFFNSPDSTDHPGQPTRLSRSALMEMEKSENAKNPPDPFSLSKGLAPNAQALSSSFSTIISTTSSVSSRLSSRSSSISDAEENALQGEDAEWTLFMEFLDDINNFFTMLRESRVSEHIVSLLKSISKTKDYLLLEELNSHCLTKHMNGRVCFLMKVAKDLIQRQEFERAVETLSEIISTDPTFIEAYNRRATALFGLHRAQECFSDLEHVLKASPLHYGALCGKGLLSMNLKAYVPALECFEKALEVNPMLSQDEIIVRSVEVCRQAVGGGGETSAASGGG